MRARIHRGALPVAVICVTLLAACGASSAPSTTRTKPTTSPGVTTTAAQGDLGLQVSPEFVQGVIPGERLVLLTMLDPPPDEPVTLTAEVSGAGADVSIQPTTILGTEIAEITVLPRPIRVEGNMSISITARIGNREQTVVKTTPVVPWPDDRGEQGEVILGLFTPWLADNEPDLGITPDTPFEGTFVAPNLLIVSHYAFFSDEWEVGVSWHIMIPPDDFAEAYLRPRGAFRPTRTFRIDSWQTALETGLGTITEVQPVAEVLR